MNRWSLPSSRDPAIRTPVHRSTPKGCTRRMASPTFSAVNPPARNTGVPDCATIRALSVQSWTRPVPPRSLSKQEYPRRATTPLRDTCRRAERRPTKRRLPIRPIGSAVEGDRRPLRTRLGLPADVASDHRLVTVFQSASASACFGALTIRRSCNVLHATITAACSALARVLSRNTTPSAIIKEYQHTDRRQSHSKHSEFTRLRNGRGARDRINVQGGKPRIARETVKHRPENIERHAGQGCPAPARWQRKGLHVESLAGLTVGVAAGDLPPADVPRIRLHECLCIGAWVLLLPLASCSRRKSAANCAGGIRPQLLCGRTSL